MSRYQPEHWPEGHPGLAQPSVGVVLANLGTPEGTDRASVRRYLKEFLSDRRVVELSPLLWQPILRGVILNTRPAKTARAYEAIWDKQANESPLRRITREQADALGERLEPLGVRTTWAMRYGRPAIGERIEELAKAGCDRLLLFPLYPQYSAATNATACDAAFRALMRLRWQPSLRVAPAYYDAPGYIGALADSVKRELAGLQWEPEVVLASFHGLPRENLEKGDPYHCHCQKTARLLREALGWDDRRLQLSFQSRFGPKEWLQPYSDETVKRLAGEGVKRLAILCPGFSADCLETLEEVALGLKETFLEAGGESFHYIPCLNTQGPHLDFLENYVRQELGGWL
jgi:ferrochelatase